ncbi:unnamed protein product [Adineta ricciae]|uniref:Uncharacterized protein n=1 Tax=Adineta ricciae TaxID=249248 RepID=A0A815H4N4_ADIRI|nr:unnamed protein product [Adineta ricciae]CAF1483717.1 unnamed protein product [Adineta ricciae]
MVLFPQSGFGRFLLFVIILSVISYLTLNIVSFAGTSWITYTDTTIRFGLWRVCDTSSSGLCNQWADSTYTSNITNFVMGTSKPTFIQSCQALEIISLIFYIVAAVLIIFGILDLGGLSYVLMFAAAAALLFICIVFISATLGVMSVQGRSGHIAYLDWAWWNGLVGLIMTIVCFFALIIFILDMKFSPTNSHIPTRTKKSVQQNVWGNVPIGPYGMAPPIVQPEPYGISQLVYPMYNQYPYEPNSYAQNYSSEYVPPPALPHHYDYNNYSQQAPYYPVENPMITYGNSYYSQPYYSESPSPLITALARQYVSDINDAQYRNHLADPYIINNYL